MVLKNIFDVISFKQFMTPTIIEVDAIGGEESEIYHEQKFQNFLDIFMENNSHSVFRCNDCLWNSVSEFLKPI